MNENESTLYDAIAAQFVAPATPPPASGGGLRPADWAVLDSYAGTLPDGVERQRLEGILLGTPKTEAEQGAARSRAGQFNLLSRDGLTAAGRVQVGYLLAAYGVRRGQ
jgi:hypothetical protein